MKNRIFAFVTAALFILCASAPARAQGGHTIRGKLRSATGEALPRIIVDLQTGNGFPIGKTTTTEDGDFDFNGLPGSSFLVVVSHPDYEPYQERVEFLSEAGENRPGETRTIEMTLTAKPTAAFAPGRVTFAQTVPPAARASFDRAVRLWGEGKAQDSVAAMQEAVKLFPDYFDARFALGGEYIKQGRLDEAIVELDHARRINPKSDHVYNAFGIILMMQRKHVVAARVFGEAAQLNAREPQYLLKRGTALLDHAATIDPSKSKAAAEERDFTLAEAEKALLRAYELSGKKLAVVHQQLARLYERKGDRARAADELEKYLRANPGAKNAEGLRQAIKTLRAPAAPAKP